MIQSVMHHGDLRSDLAKVAVSADVVALLLVEAGPGLDDGQLATSESSTKWHHAPELTKLWERVHHLTKLGEESREGLDIIILPSEEVLLIVHEVLDFLLESLLIAKNVLDLLNQRLEASVTATKEAVHHPQLLWKLHLFLAAE